MFKKALIHAINIYRNYLSVYKLRCCRFYPSCSEYAVEAIGKKGAAKGLLLSLFRIIRCNPFSKGGYDPVK